MTAYGTVQSGYQSGQFPPRPFCLFGWFFGANDQYTHACYSDIPHLYSARGFAAGLHPYLDQIPMPIQRISRGKKTSLGVALNAVTKGSSIASRIFDLPITSPNGSPTRIASPNPTMNSTALT